jgi:hypothetical protein
MKMSLVTVCSCVLLLLHGFLFCVYEVAYTVTICQSLQANIHDVMNDVFLLSIICVMLCLNFVIIFMKCIWLYYHDCLPFRFFVFLFTTIFVTCLLSVLLIFLFVDIWLVHLSYALCSFAFIMYSSNEVHERYQASTRSQEHEETHPSRTIRQILFRSSSYARLSDVEISVENGLEIEPDMKEQTSVQEQSDTNVLTMFATNDYCSICMEELSLYECCQLQCSHVYHTKCIEPWLLHYSDSCAICRYVCVVDVST